MSKINGIYAASMSIFNDDLSLSSIASLAIYTTPYPVASGRQNDPPILVGLPVNTPLPCLLVSLFYHSDKKKDCQW